jgi:uncharacterized integral membrane protein
MALFLFAIHFSIQNRDEVTLRYSIQNYQWFEVSKVPLFLVVLCSVFSGVLIGGIGDLYSRFQLKKKLRQNQKVIEQLEQEIQSLHGSGLERPSFLRKDN